MNSKKQDEFSKAVKNAIQGFRYLIKSKYKEDEVALIALIMNKEVELIGYQGDSIAKEDSDFMRGLHKDLQVIRESYKEQIEKYRRDQPYGRGFSLQYKMFPLYKRLKKPNSIYAWEWEMLGKFLRKTKGDING
jgi:hypothetical protein